MRVFGDYMRAHGSALAKVSEKHLNPEKALRVAIAAVDRDTKLQACSMNSILRSVMQAADLGFEAGGALGEAYLVPFGGQCVLIIGYQGYVSLLYQSGQIKDIQAREVYQGDLFEVEYGTGKYLRHVPCGEDDPAKITHAYAVIETTMGGVVFESMTRKQIEAVRGRSRASGSGPWVSDYAIMCRKTVLRRVQKYLPKSPQLRKAEAVEQAADTGLPVDAAEFDFIDAEFETSPASKGVDAVKGKLGVTSEPAQSESGPDLRSELLERCNTALAAKFQNPVTRKAFVANALGLKSAEEAPELGACTIDQLQAVLDALSAKPVPSE
jgi:recombination protein RecT